MADLKIYFAGSIRGGREFSDTYQQMIRMLQSLGRVFTEHVGHSDVLQEDGQNLSDREIHDRDMDWLRQSDLLIAEVSVPSLGVGYEIGRAIQLHKPVLCLCRSDMASRLSAMISGSDELVLHEYSKPEEALSVVKFFISGLSL